MLRLFTLAVLVLLPLQAAAAATLQISAADFLIGEWSAPDTGTGPNKGGTSTIHPDLDAKILLRHDHIALRQGGTLDLMMPIYVIADKLCAEYYDPEGHVIHYASAEIVPHNRIVFVSDSPAAKPAFRLTYERVSADELAVTFAIAAPGKPRDFKTYSSGHLTRAAPVH
jgi:hypothetical protein